MALANVTSLGIMQDISDQSSSQYGLIGASTGHIAHYVAIGATVLLIVFIIGLPKEF